MNKKSLVTISLSALIIIPILLIISFMYKPVFAFQGIFNSYGKFVDIAKPNHKDGLIDWWHAKTLKDGNVLVIGVMCSDLKIDKDGGKGCYSYNFISEIYNPKENKFYKNAEFPIDMSSFRVTDLNDEKVLIAGGTLILAEKGNPSIQTIGRENIKDIYIFDYKKPNSLIKIGETQNIDKYPQITLLKNGELFISGFKIKKVGGLIEIYKIINNELKLIEIYDNKIKLYMGHKETLLDNGKVLIICTQHAYLFDPDKKEFKQLIKPSEVFLLGQIAIKLKDGKVLLFGVGDDNAELFDPETEEIYFANKLNQVSNGPNSNLLNNGKVLVVGGATTNHNILGNATKGYHSITDVEIYDPKDGKFHKCGHKASKEDTPLTLLNNGSVLIMNSKTPQLFIPNN